MLPSIDELLALDALTFRDHTEQAGDRYEEDEHRAMLEKTLEVSEVSSTPRAVLRKKSIRRKFQKKLLTLVTNDTKNAPFF
ncbi:hypothetical protein LJ655_21965 [Paraburkholderia sp. MMS20-SJTN17]|uniref:Uncharacterized protein n=1 Tax=Paraburkholderia translucens TaxID=2886945 RepID=A0ABS8KIJ2_9BURK|nr:hypothetical protein [Paraburkholderia sp. MMS20-SJTN17]MCC8404515.1 hypothetical protein [Paraburkholderia sp. MMS20-SJTN17]